MRLTPILLAATLPHMALAECPVADDLATGIVFEVGDSDTETFLRQDDQLIYATYEDKDGIGSRVLLGQGVYLLELVDTETGNPLQGTRSTYSFPLLPGQMPQILPGSTWTVKVATLDTEGLGEEVQHYSFGTAAEASFGACTYDMIPIEILYMEDSDEPTIDHLTYLPKLGISFLAATDYDGELERYFYHTIRRAE